MDEQPAAQLRAQAHVTPDLIDHHALARHFREQLAVLDGLLTLELRANTRDRLDRVACRVSLAAAGQTPARPAWLGVLPRSCACGLRDDRIDLVRQIERQLYALAIEFRDLR